jgi:hypothetical protein
MSDSSLVWRVNRRPRFPILSLGEYMAADDGPRQTMRRNMKFERIAPTLLYRKVQRAVAGYLASPVRDRRILNQCRDDLEAERSNVTSPKAKENATYALRALDTFERSLNALPVGGVTVQLAPTFRAHMIESVKVSIQPTVLISVTRPRGRTLRGAIIVDTAKGIEPRTDDARRRATEGMMHAAYLLHEHVAGAVVMDGERPSPEHCMIFHTHRQELVCSPTNYKKLLRNVEAACRDITTSWESIAPPSSFDPAKARYRD